VGDPGNDAPFIRAWTEREPGRLIGKGHPAGDFLEAHRWRVLEESPGLLRIRAHLPEHVKNPRGQLFGGFTPTYVDLVALFTVRTEEPILGPEFDIESRLVKSRGRTRFVETRFLGLTGELAVFSTTTIREIPLDRALGDA
jgi:acyl-coenzyme A thioesterase PaaI-like protein